MTKPLSPGMNQLLDQVFNFYCEAVGKPTPRHPDIAEALGVETFRVDNAVTWLKRHGKLTVKGVGGSRTVHIEGVGSTTTRTSAGMAARKLKADAVEPDYPRVDNWTCGKCGGRNCTQHGRGYLSAAARIPAYLGARA